eukprot:435651-Pyramimonas_sp.AAC.1
MTATPTGLEQPSMQESLAPWRGCSARPSRGRSERLRSRGRLAAQRLRRGAAPPLCSPGDHHHSGAEHDDER